MEEKGFGEVSAVRPGKAKESKKKRQRTLSMFHLSSGGHSGSYKERLKDVK